MTKVVQITTIHKRYDSRVFYKECVSLARRGFETYLIVADSKGDEVKDGVNIIDVGAERSRVKQLFCASHRAYKKAKSLKAEIYHFHDADFFLFAKKLQTKHSKVFFDSHEDFTQLMLQRAYIPNCLRNFLFRITTALGENITTHISGVITATEHIEEKFKRYGAKRTQTIMNFPIIENQEKQEQKANNDFVACYVGGLTQVRGVTQMVLACAQAGVKLLLVGPFDSQAYLEELKGLPQWKNVEYMDFVPHSELHQRVYSKASVGLCLLQKAPNHTYSIPIKQLEYMQEGLPVVTTTQVEFCKDITKETNCGLCVCPTDIKEIADAILTLKNNPSLCSQMSANGKRAIKEKYNWAKEEEKLISFYNAR